MTFDACLKFTKVELDLLCDLEEFLFIKNNIRDALSVVSHRHCRANNPFVPDYKDAEPNSFIAFLDCTNVNGLAMSQTLPTENFEFMTDEQIINFNIFNTDSNDATWYILEINLLSPRDLHDWHSDCLLAPQKLKVLHEMLSPYSRVCLFISTNHMRNEFLIYLIKIITSFTTRL